MWLIGNTQRPYVKKEYYTPIKEATMSDDVMVKDTLMDIVIQMSAGNPGALSVCRQMIYTGAAVEPGNPFGGIGCMLALGIHGSEIWMLYKDVCRENLTRTLGVLRAWQLDFVTSEALIHAINHRGEGIDADELLTQVREALPEFGRVC